MGLVIFTIGHSTRPLVDHLELLRRHHVRTLVDIRKIPRSGHNPQYNRDDLRSALVAAGIDYRHEPRLGGLRRPAGESSVNRGWRSAGFRAYADYMLTAQFATALADLIDLGHTAGPIAIMCAEAAPWRCHRSLVSDALVARGIEVRHIVDRGEAAPHRMTSFARVEGACVTYPQPEPPLFADSTGE